MSVLGAKRSRFGKGKFPETTAKGLIDFSQKVYILEKQRQSTFIH